MGADGETVDDILKALFSKGSLSKGLTGAVGMEQFVKRASRMRNPMQLNLMQAGNADTTNEADAEAYKRLI
jgi:hypothetical protein